MAKQKFTKKEVQDIAVIFGAKNVSVNRGGSVVITGKGVEGKTIRENTIVYVFNRQPDGEIYVRRNVKKYPWPWVKPGEYDQYVIHRNPKTGEYNGFKTVRQAASWLFWYGTDIKERAAKK